MFHFLDVLLHRVHGAEVALKNSMTNFMRTYAGETYWAASDIGWAA